MPHPRVRLAPTDADIPQGVLQALRDRFTAVRAELGLSLDYPADALAEAEQVAAAPPDLPGRDETALPFFTVDPAGSMDLDQAMHLERDGDGHHIRYAIADVPAFVRLGGALDRVTRERGQTVYCPDVRVPLHPEVLSEAAASLLPDAVRPAFVWDLRLDGAGALTSADLYRAMVRSVERLDYVTIQAAIDAGTDDDRFLMLREIGERRIAQERARGGASLPMPEQQVTARDRGGFTLEFRPPVAAEEWNAQVSLLTGMAAATMMLDAGVGVLRTMPAPDAGGGQAVPPGGPRAGHRVGRGPPLRRVRAGRWTGRTHGTWPSSTRRPRCSAAPATRPSTASCRSSASTRPSPPPMPTSPRRCDASSTASAWSSARPRPAAPTCRMPCARPCRCCPS